MYTLSIYFMHIHQFKVLIDFFCEKGCEPNVAPVGGSYTVEFASNLVTSVFDDAMSKVQCSDSDRKVCKFFCAELFNFVEFM